MAKSGLSADGVATGPLVAFVNTLSGLTREMTPSRLAVCWDGGRSDYRVAIDPDYKAHRLDALSDTEALKHSAFALIKEFLTLSGVFHIERPGIEADDLISYYVNLYRDATEIVIASSDKDFLQLLQPGGLRQSIEQVRFTNAGLPEERWTAARVAQELGCAPEDIPYAMALAGDESDNVHGVPRFGMKTAVKALRQAGWSFETVLENPKVQPYREQVERNLRLVDLRMPMEDLVLQRVPAFAPTEFDSPLFEDLTEFLDRYRLKVLRQKVDLGILWR